MICGNTQAEIERDTETELQDRVREEERSKQWLWTRDTLLTGTTVYTFARAYDLNVHIINKYHKELNPDYDFVAGYNENDIDPALRKLVEREADALASKIMED